MADVLQEVLSQLQGRQALFSAEPEWLDDFLKEMLGPGAGRSDRELAINIFMRGNMVSALNFASKALPGRQVQTSCTELAQARIARAFSSLQARNPSETDVVAASAIPAFAIIGALIQARPGSHPCIYANTQIYVEENGNVRPCCQGPVYGKADQHSLRDFFNSEAAVDLRARLADPDRSRWPNVCQSCNMITRVGDMRLQDMYPQVLFEQIDREIPEHEVFLHNFESLALAQRTSTPILPGSNPLTIQIQLGERCNLRCIMCPQEHDPQNIIQPDYRKAVVESLKGACIVTFTGGEPLGYREFWDIVSEMPQHAGPATRVNVLTNAQLLTRDKVQQLLDPLPMICLGINIDACTKETYEHIRRPGKWDRLLQNVGYFHSHIKEHKKKWEFGFGFVVMKSNISEIKGAIQFAKTFDTVIGFGPVNGTYMPIKNCRTYLEENIFKYEHLEYSVDRIEAILTDALAACGDDQAAHDSIIGMISHAKTVRRISIPPADVARLRAIRNDAELSMEMSQYGM